MRLAPRADSAVHAILRQAANLFAPHIRGGLSDLCKQRVRRRIQLFGDHAQIYAFQCAVSACHRYHLFFLCSFSFLRDRKKVSANMRRL